MGDKPIHLASASHNGQDYDTWTACGLGDCSDRAYENGTKDINKVTCKNCIRIAKATNEVEK